MKLYTECNFESFEPWSGAIDTHARICNAGKAEEFEAIIEGAYPEGLSDTDLNDILWFEPEWCYNMVGLRTESEIREEIEEKEARQEELKEEFEMEAEDLREEFETYTEAEEAVNKLYREAYEGEILELEAEINDLREELETI